MSHPAGASIWTMSHCCAQSVSFGMTAAGTTIGIVSRRTSATCSPLALQQQVPQLVGVDLRRVVDDEVAQPVQVLRALPVLRDLQARGRRRERADHRTLDPAPEPHQHDVRQRRHQGAAPDRPRLPAAEPVHRADPREHVAQDLAQQPDPPLVERLAVGRPDPEPRVGVVDPLEPAGVLLVARILEDDARLLEPRRQVVLLDRSFVAIRSRVSSSSMGTPVPCTSRRGKILMVPP